MNNAKAVVQAKHFAQRMAVEAGYSTEAQVNRAFELALSGKPTATEKAKTVSFLESTPTGLVDLGQTLFNLNEFLYRQ